jgi:predicted MPP superfamily phosphohydrolase
MQRESLFTGAWNAASSLIDVDEDHERSDSLASSGRWRFRTLWISDLHLGTPGCQTDALLDFLKHTECKTLFLVGDIIDGWQLRRQWYWPQSHNDVIQKLLRKARKGTRVILIPGNHDEFARRYVGRRSAHEDLYRGRRVAAAGQGGVRLARSLPPIHRSPRPGSYR